MAFIRYFLQIRCWIFQFWAYE